MPRKTLVAIVAIVAILPFVRSANGELTATQVQQSIDLGVRYLLSRQDKVKGNWPEHIGQPGGLSALCTLSLLNSGVDPKSDEIQRALNYLRSLGKPEMVYSTALQTMVFATVDGAERGKDRHLIVRNVQWLESVQITTGERKGAWAYSGGRGNGDNSNAQFALLGLHEAARIGVPVREQTWRLAANYWLDTQMADGSWGYFSGQPATGSMTCAGIASLIITMDRLPEYHGDAQVTGNTVNCCGKQSDAGKLELGLRWLSNHFSYTTNPTARGIDLGQSNLLYYLYCVERVGRLSGRRFFDKHDWYREGADYLINQAQDSITGKWVGVGHAESNPNIATSLALLFLAKGRRPILLAKYKHSNDTDWDLHRGGVQNLTRHVERAWKRDLTWQTIEARAATVDSLMETPVLFISGRDGLDLSADQKESLKQYINQGGFIFAENCCGGAGFDRDFRKLMSEILPSSQLRLLSADHPAWFAEGKVDPKLYESRPLYGVDACCRTSVVYCMGNLSCYWELARDGTMSAYPKSVQDEVQACVTIGQNVLAYATNRELHEKLNRPKVAVSDSVLVRTRDLLYIPKLSHGGGSDDAPNAWPNLLRLAGDQIKMRISTEKRLVAPDNPKLFDYPIVFMHGRRNFRFTPTQRKAIATYVERGGLIFADSICASSEFTESFRTEMKAIFPDSPLDPILADHPLLTDEYSGYNLKTVMLRRPHARAEDGPLTAKLTSVSPRLEGLEFDGRLAVIFSPIDISCALENHASLECESYEKTDAAKIGINVLLFALQQ